MKILVMIDSFKGSLSSFEAGTIIKETIENMDKDNEVKVLPIADGGEGTLDAMISLPGLDEVTVMVKNPLMEDIKASYAFSKEDKVAIMEMSQSSGLTLIEDRLSPMEATTYGLGQMIIDGLDRGARDFIIGIGGSATNDGGIGMLEALGYKFLDKDGNPIPKGIGGVEKLEKILTDDVDKRVFDAKFSIACDVDNPLCGKKGAAYVYGPQKGASEDQVKKIDEYLGKYHELSKKVLDNPDATYPGVGAAGGLGYAFKNYLNATMESGIDLILEKIEAEKYIEEVDLVITGEGKMDFQTSMGKTPVGVAKLAKKHNKKVLAFAGVVDNDAKAVNAEGIDAFFPILDKIRPLEEALDKEVTKKNLQRAVEQVINVINIWSK